MCLYCRPKKVHIDGYGPFRAHLRVKHGMNWLDSAESNRCRTDGGYYYDGQHYFVNSPGYESWRAIGVGNAPPRAPTENARGITMSSDDFSRIIENVTGTVQKSVDAGVNTTLRSAAAFAGLMGPQPTMDNSENSRRYFPVPNTNNVMVSINNVEPSAGPSAGKSHILFPDQSHS